MANDPDRSETPDGHVSVVYFHGMGSQRRYEETSRLIDSIDSYLGNERRDRGRDRGKLFHIDPLMEPHNQKNDETVTYIRTEYAPENSTYGDETEVRFYEVYWAPIMAGSSSTPRVVKWILRQSLRPWETLSTKWRERQRLRRSALANLQDRAHIWDSTAKEEDFDDLLEDYVRYDNLGTKRQYPAGTFDEFRTFLDDRHAETPDKAVRLRRLAREWHKFYLRTEIGHAFSLLTILVALILTGLLLVAAALQMLLVVSSAFTGDGDASTLMGNPVEPTIATAVSVVTALLSAFFGKFLVDYMGDVEAWSTYEETDEKHQRRKRVMALGTDLMKHVLADDDCKRVVVVSHSLGTSVAHDTILSVVRENRATNRADPISGPIQLTKLRHFVTMASPIDKINYFFESYRSDFHRYTRVVEDLRGDISKEPFSRNNKPYVHWVNFYDEADVISGGLQSPVGTQTLSNRVDNVHVANLHFPNPGASHSAYFQDRTVIASLFEMAYLDAGNYGRLRPTEPGKGLDYASVQVGPGEGFGHSKWFLLSVIAVPWVGCAALFMWMMGWSLGLWLGVALGIGIAVLFVLFVAGSRKGQRLPI